MKKILFLLFSAMISQVGHSQTLSEVLQSGETDFEKICLQVDQHYRENPTASGQKQYGRWAYFQRNRLNQAGHIQNIGAVEFSEYEQFKKQSNKKSRRPSGEWISLGMDESSSFMGSNNTGVGRVNCFAVDPDDEDLIYAGTPGGGVWRSTDQGSNWAPISDGLPLSIGISSIVVADAPNSGQNPVYILTGDGDAAQNPYVGVFVSFDDGESWFGTSLRELDPASNIVFGHKLIVDPNDHEILFALIGDEVFKTTDGFITNTQVLTNSTARFRFTDIEFQPGSSSILYASGLQNSVYQSISSGNSGSWQLLGTANGLPAPTTSNLDRVQLGISPADPDVVYVLYGHNNTPANEYDGLFRSNDGGSTFNQQSDQPNIMGRADDGLDDDSQSWYDLAIAVNPDDEDELWVGGINVWHSDDGGVTWDLSAHQKKSTSSAGYVHADIHNFLFSGDLLFCGSDGGASCLDFTNSSKNWVNIWDGLVISQAYRIGFKRKFSLSLEDGWHMGLQDNGTHFVNDNDISGKRFRGGDGFECFSRNDYWYTCVQRGQISRHRNNPFFTETDITPTAYQGATGSAEAPWLTPYNFDPSDPNEETMVISYMRDVFRSIDGGNNWNQIGNNAHFGGLLMDLIDGVMVPSTRNHATHIAIAESDPNVIYVSFDNRDMYRTTDLGLTWNQLTPIAPAFTVITYFTIDPDDEDHVWISVGGFVEDTDDGYTTGSKVFETTNGGNTWANISQGLPNLPATCIIHDEDSDNDPLYLAMDIGVYYRDNTMSEWTMFSNGLPNVIVSELEIRRNEEGPDVIVAGTFGRGIWESELYGRECVANFQFSNSIEHDDRFSFDAIDFIESEATLENYSDIRYRGGDYIELNPGFEANANENLEQVFEGRISDICNVLINKRQKALPVTGTYAGLMPGLVDNTGLMDVPIADSRMELYPNPTADFLTIELEMGQSSQVNFLLYDAKGRVVSADWPRDRTFEEGANTFNLRTSHLQSGIYFLRAVSDSGTLIQSFMKE